MPGCVPPFSPGLCCAQVYEELGELRLLRGLQFQMVYLQDPMELGCFTSITGLTSLLLGHLVFDGEMMDEQVNGIPMSAINQLSALQDLQILALTLNNNHGLEVSILMNVEEISYTVKTYHGIA